MSCPVPHSRSDGHAVWTADDIVNTVLIQWFLRKSTQKRSIVVSVDVAAPLGNPWGLFPGAILTYEDTGEATTMYIHPVPRGVSIKNIYPGRHTRRTTSTSYTTAYIFDGKQCSWKEEEKERLVQTW